VVLIAMSLIRRGLMELRRGAFDLEVGGRRSSGLGC
jgi:hypothetical protein